MCRIVSVRDSASFKKNSPRGSDVWHQKSGYDRGFVRGGVDLLLTQSQAPTCRVFLAVCRLPTRADGSRTPICGSDGSEAIMISSVFRV